MIQYAKIIYQPEATPEYPYNVHIITNGYYAGVGRFCRTVDEAGEWLEEHFPNIEVK